MLWEEKPGWVLAWEKLPVRKRLELLKHHVDGHEAAVLSERDNFGDLPKNLQGTLRGVFGGGFFITPDGGEKKTARRRS